jgi:hypothetical protein
MTKINEILTLDLREDIKNVIDLEDRSELEIQQEIEAYIVTEGIGRHLYNFTNQFTSNIKETGVWLSGFYGSGKSYLGKMLGYIISNPVINGTPARERFIPRLKGISDGSLTENAIRNLESINSRVIFLDVAKQNTDNGFAFTLFANLLKSLGFREDEYGYMEFDLFIQGKYNDFLNIANELTNNDWENVKQINKEVVKIMHRTFLKMDYTENEYNDIKNIYGNSIKTFSANKLKDEIEKLLQYKPDTTIVFIFDEASEAISQQKFTLLDLEGISEALSSISSKVWTIAIAQEKLDDVIDNANVNRSQLIKVTDRFKTKIHLESTEVDVIIRSRLLQKKESYHNQLVKYYKKNEGLISDATNLKSSFPTKTTSDEEFAIYYPFHKYQFDILQKFLFSSNALVATQIAARGMIITTFDVLRKQMRDQELFAFTSGYAICNEAQPAPPVGLVNKYDTARKILNEKNLNLDGEKLLKTIHLLSDSEIISPTVESITKSYISDISTYYDIKPKIEEMLHLLVEAKVLLLSNNNYKITSDLEGKLLEEMKDIDVELFSKKRFLINYLKNNKFFNTVATLSDGIDSFKFSVLSDQDDELCSPGSKQLKLNVYSLFNITGNRQDFIEQVKLKTQHSKDLITLIPDNSEFPQVDKLIGEISRYSHMEDKYKGDVDSTKRQIIREFSIIREEKDKHLRIKIENAYRNASLIYRFDEHILDSNTFKGTFNEVQQKLVKNIYTKRLTTQLSEGLVLKIFTNRKEDLSRLFSGNDFKFFDSNGNFTGDHLKVVEEINAKILSRFVDGKSLESDLSGAPWGYSFGTIVSTLAVLLRVGRLSVKYNGESWFSHDQKGVHEAFTNATRFKSASFKSITATLTAAQKNAAVQLLMDIDIKEHTGRNVDWNTNDFDLADTIRFAADHFIGALTTLDETVAHFESIFSNVTAQKSILQEYTGKVTESNYIDKVEFLLATGDTFKSSIQTILKAQKFIKKSFSKVKEYKRFIENVVSELKKADRSDDGIRDVNGEFQQLYNQDIVKNFAQLQQQAQMAKDSYFKLFKITASGMTHEYKRLLGKVDGATRNLKQNFPSELNTTNLKNLENLNQYCTGRIVGEPNLEFSITCRDCDYSLSDILNYIALVPNKESELLIIQSSFITEAPPQLASDEGQSDKPAVPKQPRKIRLQVPGTVITVQVYRSLLTAQLTALAGALSEEEIELDIEIL